MGLKPPVLNRSTIQKEVFCACGDVFFLPFCSCHFILLVPIFISIRVYFSWCGTVLYFIFLKANVNSAPSQLSWNRNYWTVCCEILYFIGLSYLISRALCMLNGFTVQQRSIILCNKKIPCTKNSFLTCFRWARMTLLNVIGRTWRLLLILKKQFCLENILFHYKLTCCVIINTRGPFANLNWDSIINWI